MDDGQFEQMLARLVQADFSAGTGTFREELLARCLAVVNADMHDGSADPDADCRIVELDDADLEMLAAAGDGAHSTEPPSPEGGGSAFGRCPGLDA